VAFKSQIPTTHQQSHCSSPSSSSSQTKIENKAIKFIFSSFSSPLLIFFNNEIKSHPPLIEKKDMKVRLFRFVVRYHHTRKNLELFVFPIVGLWGTTVVSYRTQNGTFTYTINTTVVHSRRTAKSYIILYPYHFLPSLLPLNHHQSINQSASFELTT